MNVICLYLAECYYVITLKNSTSGSGVDVVEVVGCFIKVTKLERNSVSMAPTP